MPLRFAQVSDPHLSSLERVRWRDLLNKRLLGYLSWRRKRRFEHRAEVLEVLCRDLQEHRPDHLLISGDLTHIGLPQEFREARAWLERLGNPRQVAVVPGNHDAYVAAGWDETFALWRDYMASDEGGGDATELFPSLRVRGDVAFIGMSTSCPKPPLLATGTVGVEQLGRLPALLEQAAREGLFRVIYLHHSPLPGEEKWRKRLTDADAVAAVIAEYGAELVLHGHGHRAHAGELPTRHGAVPVVAAPSASAMGLHGAEPAGYNLFSVARSADGWRLESEFRRYVPERNGFLAAERSVLDLARSY